MTRTSAKGMLQSIAEQAGCSPSTVSRVLNGCKKGFSVKRELEERILAIANSLDYHPNPFLRVMRANDSKIIAIFDPATNSSETLHKAKAAFIGCIRQAGYLDTGKYVSLYNQESYTLPFPVAAALLFDISDTSFLAFLERREIPYVVINGISREGGAAIRHDEAQNVRTAIDYLAATGHRRIVYYYGCRQEAPSHRHISAEQRPEFFRENHRRLKLEHRMGIAQTCGIPENGARRIFRRRGRLLRSCPDACDPAGGGGAGGQNSAGAEPPFPRRRIPARPASGAGGRDFRLLPENGRDRRRTAAEASRQPPAAGRTLRKSSRQAHAPKIRNLP